MKSSQLIVAQSMAVRHTVRISTYSCGLEKQIQKSFVLPLIRVGLLVIYSCSPELLKKPIELQVMCRRMLIAVLTFLSFLKRPFLQNILIVKVSVAVINFFLYLRFCRSSNQDISLILAKKLEKESPILLSALFPNTLYIDTSLSSRDIVALLALRNATIYSDLQNVLMNMKSRNVVDFGK